MHCGTQQMVQMILRWLSFRGFELRPTSSTERFEVQVRSTLLLSLYAPRPKAVWLYCGFHVTHKRFQCFECVCGREKMAPLYNDRNYCYYYYK
jgi:hypothetical protein